MRRVLRRSARGAEAFGFHQCRIVPELDERGRGRLHQWRRAADEDVRPLARRPGDLRQHHAIDPAPKSGPPPRRLARERERDLERLVVLGQSGELITIDHVVPSPRRVQQPCWHLVPGADVGGLERAARWRSIAIRGTIPEPPATRSSGPPSATSQTKYPPIGPRSSSRSPTRSTSVRYGETSPSSSRSTVSAIRASSRRRRNGVAPLRLVSILRRQPHVHVLARAVAGPPRDVEDERARPRRFLHDVDDGSEPPRDRRRARRHGNWRAAHGSPPYRCSRHGSP